MKIEERVEELTNEIIAANGFPMETVDVEYVTERKEHYLRIFIDKEGGVSLDDCGELSELIGAKLDAEDFIKDRYILEVSSPGIDRQLKKPRDFVREKGKAVDVVFYAPRPKDGKKFLTGVLADYDGNDLTLDEGEVIPVKDIATARLHIDI